MTRKERLMRTIRGEPVDRPAVSFYELNGLDENPAGPDPFNIFSHPSWKPLIELTREKTDRIVMRGIIKNDIFPYPLQPYTKIKRISDNLARREIITIKYGRSVFTTRTRRDRDMNNTWTEEHVLKNEEDLKQFLAIPFQSDTGSSDLSSITETEGKLKDTGIVMIDIPDPLCMAAELFSMQDYLVIALTETALFRQLLDKFMEYLLPRVETAASLLPGRLWRIFGPEYASPAVPAAGIVSRICHFL